MRRKLGANASRYDLEPEEKGDDDSVIEVRVVSRQSDATRIGQALARPICSPAPASIEPGILTPFFGFSGPSSMA